MKRIALSLVVLLNGCAGAVWIDFQGKDGVKHSHKMGMCRGSTMATCEAAAKQIHAGDLEGATATYVAYLKKNRLKVSRRRRNDVLGADRQLMRNLRILHTAQDHWLPALDLWSEHGIPNAEDRYLLAHASVKGVGPGKLSGDVGLLAKWRGWGPLECKSGKVTISGARPNVRSRNKAAITVRKGCTMIIKDSLLRGMRGISVTGGTLHLVNTDVEAVIEGVAVGNGTFTMKGGSIRTRSGPDYWDGVGDRPRKLLVGLRALGGKVELDGVRVLVPESIRGEAAVVCRQGASCSLTKSEVRGGERAFNLGSGSKATLRDTTIESDDIAMHVHDKSELRLEGGRIQGKKSSLIDEFGARPRNATIEGTTFQPPLKKCMRLQRDCKE